MAMSPADRLNVQEKVGHPPFTVDLRITDDAGNELPWDDKTQGRLWIRGPGVIKRYHRAEKDATEAGDWFDTGDMATIDAHAYVRITDRSKDVIKSGGEWISSIDLENAVMGHPGVAQAAAIARPHPKWQERPLLVVVPREGARPEKEEVLTFLADKVATWWLPDDVVFVDVLPMTATGKVSKARLREQFKDYRLPTT
jgi:fatty-acyl-CoA synthase